MADTIPIHTSPTPHLPTDLPAINPSSDYAEYDFLQKWTHTWQENTSTVQLYGSWQVSPLRVSRTNVIASCSGMPASMKKRSQKFWSLNVSPITKKEDKVISKPC